MTTFWIKNENRSIDRLRCKVALEGLMNGHTVHVRVINKPNDLIAKKFRVVLGVQVGLSRLGTVQLETLSDPFS